MQRIYEHRRNTREDQTYKANWIRSLKAKGLTFESTILERCDFQSLADTELWWIHYAKLAGWPLTNTSEMRYGEYLIRALQRAQRSAQHCENLSKAHKVIAQTPEGKARFAKIAEARRGTTQSEEFKRRQSERLKGVPRSPEARKKISEGHKNSPKARANHEKMTAYNISLRQPCGTMGAYERAKQAKREGQPGCGPCEACMRCSRDYARERYQKKLSKAVREQAATKSEDI